MSEEGRAPDSEAAGAEAPCVRVCLGGGHTLAVGPLQLRNGGAWSPPARRSARTHARSLASSLACKHTHTHTPTRPPVPACTCASVRTCECVCACVAVDGLVVRLHCT